jgi:hypothetical protein
LHDLALKRRRFVMTLRQHHNSEHHQKLMALLPWHHVFHFLSVEDILSCACVSRVCSMTARVLLKSIMGLVVKYEAPGDMRMRILRDADRIATSLDASKTLSFASIYSTKVLIALVEVCRRDGSGDISADKIAGGSTANHLAARTALLLAFHESHSNKDSTDNSSKSLIPPPAIVPRRGSGSKRRSSAGNKHNASAVSSNNSNESSPLAQGDANATDSATGNAAKDASGRISSIIEVIHMILQIEPEDLTTEALDAIRDIPQSPGRGGKQRSPGPTISFRDHLLSTYGDHHQSTSPRYGRMSSSAPTEDDVDDAHQSVLRPLVNYLLTLAHLHRMKAQARRYLKQPFSTL